MTVQEMIARQRQITEQARSEGRDLTEAEKTEFDRLQRQIDAGDGNRGAATGGQEPPASAPGKEDPDAAGQRAALAERAQDQRDPGTLPEIRSGTRTRLFPGETVLTRSGRLYWTSWKEMDRLFQSVLLRMQGTRNGLPWWTGSF